MNTEREKGLANSLRGPEAEAVKERVLGICAGWGVALPPTEPMVFDFGLGDFEHIGETEFWIANEEQHGYCGKYMFLFSGQRCPEHMHREKHETFFIVRGEVEMTVAGSLRIMRPGDVLPLETGTLHTFRAVTDCLILEISKPSVIADNYFTDPRLGYRL